MSQDKNQPWKNDNWFVSPWNYLEEVRQGFNLPSQVRIHDVTLRDGEQQAGVIFSKDDKIRIAEKLAEVGVHRIEAGMPAVSPNDEAAIPEHAQAWAQATDPDVLATYLDIDDVMWAWGLEAALPNTDGFVYGYHNFYLYDHPESGFTWVPSDLDYTFDGSQHLDVQPFNVDPLTYYRCGNGPQFLLFRDDPDWRERYIAEIARAMDVYDEDELIARWAEWDAQIHQALQDDPNRLYDMATHDAHIADVQLFIQRRADFMREWVERNR